MWLHYHKHEQNYLNQLNRLLEKFHYDYCYGLEELLYHIQEFPVSSQEDLLFYLGGVLNHNLYWMGMSTKRKGPHGKLKIQLEKTFGSYDGFWKIFKEKALQMKGSGYTFLVLNRDGQLEIMNVSNQDTPLLFGYIPLFTVDMWEHAYYLNYENDKAKYLDNFFFVADFENASEIFSRVISK